MSLPNYPELVTISLRDIPPLSLQLLSYLSDSRVIHDIKIIVRQQGEALDSE